jgi:hypothetical protein
MKLMRVTPLHPREPALDSILDSVDPLVHLLDPLVHLLDPLFDLCGALLDLTFHPREAGPHLHLQVVEPVVAPALPHRLHIGSLENQM